MKQNTGLLNSNNVLKENNKSLFGRIYFKIVRLVLHEKT